MGLADSLKEKQLRQRLALLVQQYEAVSQQLLTEQNPVMRPLLETQQEQIGSQIDEVEAQIAASSPAEASRRQSGWMASALPPVGVWRGREALLAELLADCGDDRRNAIVLLGQGGMGKSSLAAKLVEALGVDPRSGASGEGCEFAAAIAFRAYEGSSFDEVSGLLLAGLGIEEEPQGAREVVAAIVRGLAERRVLVVLDNLESVLRPPRGANSGRAVSAEWSDLIQALATGNHRSLAIVTSREEPADFTDRRIAGARPNRRMVRVRRVEQVDEASAIEILREQGMRDSPEDLAWIAGRVDGHPIYLELLAANYGDMPGFLRKHPQELAGGVDEMLRRQLVRQSEAARDLARRMCLLRVPIDVRGLTFLRLYRDDDERFESEEVRTLRELKKLLAQLSDSDESVQEEEETRAQEGFTLEELAETSGILNALVCGSLVRRQYDESQCADEFSMHRVIVEFLERELGEVRSGILESVYRFYRSGQTVEKPQELADLQPLLEAQFFAFQLGNYREAMMLIGELEKYLDPWGYWTLKKELCEQVLPHLDRASQPYILQRIGLIYRGWGDWERAETYYRQALELATAESDRAIIAGLQGNLGDIERNRGNWEAAERLYRQSLEI
ncbi:MAG: tetratricopeptide repeat protein [Geitlerinemataceae cyanobacterium]